MKKLFLIALFTLATIVSVDAQSTTQKKQPPPDCQPKISTAQIRSLLYGQTLPVVRSSYNEAEKPTDWTFGKKELIEIDVLETSTVNNQLVVVIKIKTGDAPGFMRRNRTGYDVDAFVLEGRLRLTFETIADELTLLKVENLTVKYDRSYAEIQRVN